MSDVYVHLKVRNGEIAFQGARLSIVNHVFDPQPSYHMAQELRRNFPKTIVLHKAGVPVQGVQSLQRRAEKAGIVLASKMPSTPAPKEKTAPKGELAKALTPEAEAPEAEAPTEETEDAAAEEAEAAEEETPAEELAELLTGLSLAELKTMAEEKGVFKTTLRTKAALISAIVEG